MSNVLRSMRRARARKNMENMGYQKFCKHSYTQGINLSGKPASKIKEPSVFSEKWRELVNGTIFKRRKGE